MTAALPALTGGVSLAHAAVAVAIFVTGYAVHEAAHVVALAVLGHEWTLSVFPRGFSLRELFLGTVVEIEVAPGVPRRHAVAAALAPGVVALVPTALLAMALASPAVEVGALVVIVAWFVVSVPSLRDWATVLTYEPDHGGGTVEVQA